MLYRGVPASLANSSGIFLGDTAHCDIARPGAALYGINPTPRRPNPMQSVVELTGRILQMRKVDRGETVGYGAAWTAQAGLAHRHRRARLCRRRTAFHQRHRRQSGRRSHHRRQTLPDRRRNLHGSYLRRRHRPCRRCRCSGGDVATFIGKDLSVDEVAAVAGTIGYEILTRLGPRSHLVYRGG